MNNLFEYDNGLNIQDADTDHDGIDERVRRVALVSLIGISVHQSEVIVEQGIIEEIMNNLKKII